MHQCQSLGTLQIAHILDNPWLPLCSDTTTGCSVQTSPSAAKGDVAFNASIMYHLNKINRKIKT